MTLAVVIAVAFFLTYWQAGREWQMSIRCVMCGSRYGEKHHRDCPWGKS